MLTPASAGAHRWPLVSAYSVSKAAVVKLTENLAYETSRYGVSVFSVHPGLLPIGMSETVIEHAPSTPHERLDAVLARVHEVRDGDMYVLRTDRLTGVVPHQSATSRTQPTITRRLR